MLFHRKKVDSLEFRILIETRSGFKITYSHRSLIHHLDKWKGFRKNDLTQNFLHKYGFRHNTTTDKQVSLLLVLPLQYF